MKRKRDYWPSEIKGAPEVFTIRTGGFMSQWCCGCGLRHIWHFRVARGKNSAQDEVEISLLCDETATRLLRQKRRESKHKTIDL